jgi:hypothetical protein
MDKATKKRRKNNEKATDKAVEEGRKKATNI